MVMGFVRAFLWVFYFICLVLFLDVVVVVD